LGVPLYRRVAATAKLEEIRPGPHHCFLGHAEYSAIRRRVQGEARSRVELYRERLAPIVIVTGGGAATQFTKMAWERLSDAAHSNNAIIANALQRHAQSAERVARSCGERKHAALAVSEAITCTV